MVTASAGSILSVISEQNINFFPVQNGMFLGHICTVHVLRDELVRFGCCFFPPGEKVLMKILSLLGLGRRYRTHFGFHVSLVLFLLSLYYSGRCILGEHDIAFVMLETTFFNKELLCLARFRNKMCGNIPL